MDIGTLGYLTNSIYPVKDGTPCLDVSFFANALGDDVKLCKDLTDFTWVGSMEASDYDLIDGIAEEFRSLDRKLRDGDGAICEILGAKC